jgi:hypothetical protein
MRLDSTFTRAALALLFSCALLPVAYAQPDSGGDRRPAVAAPPQTAHAARASEGFPIERYLNIRAASSPALSPAGDRVAFLLNVTGTPQVWSVAATGGWPEQLTFYTDRVDFVRWSPDGAAMIFGKARGGDENAQLYWMSADGARVRQLTDSPKIRYNFGAWSADSHYISYASNKRNPNFFDVYRMSILTGEEDLIYQQDGSNAPAAWSPDGRFIVVSRSSDTLSLDNDLYLIELATKKVTHLTPHEGAAQFGDVHFTRDNRALILSTNVAGEWQSLARMDLATRRIESATDALWDTDASEIRAKVDGRRRRRGARHARRASGQGRRGRSRLLARRAQARLRVRRCALQFRRVALRSQDAQTRTGHALVARRHSATVVRRTGVNSLQDLRWARDSRVVLPS